MPAQATFKATPQLNPKQATSTIYVDASRDDEYTPSGTIITPYKSIDAALPMISIIPLSAFEGIGDNDPKVDRSLLLMPSHEYGEVIIDRSVNILGSGRTVTTIQRLEIPPGSGAITLLNMSVEWLEVGTNNYVTIENCFIGGATINEAFFRVSNARFALPTDSYQTDTLTLTDCNAFFSNCTIVNSLILQHGVNDGTTITLLQFCHILSPAITLPDDDGPGDQLTIFLFSRTSATVVQPENSNVWNIASSLDNFTIDAGSYFFFPIEPVV